MTDRKPLTAAQVRQHMIRCWPKIVPELRRLQDRHVPRSAAVSLLVQLIHLPITDDTIGSMDLMIAASASLDAIGEENGASSSPPTLLLDEQLR